MRRSIRYCRPRTAQPETLLEYLRCRFRYFDSEQWCNEIASGYVAVNRIPCTEAQRILLQGDDISFSPPSEREPAVDVDHIAVCFGSAARRQPPGCPLPTTRDVENTSASNPLPPFLVCEKNGNLPVCAGGRYFNHTLLAFLEKTEAVAPLKAEVSPRKRRGPPADSLPRLFPVHRLDKETSGLVVLARTRAAAAAFGEAFSAHAADLQGRDVREAVPLNHATPLEVRKAYIAVLNGCAEVGRRYDVTQRIGLRSEASSRSSVEAACSTEEVSPSSQAQQAATQGPLDKLVMACYPPDTSLGKPAHSRVMILAACDRLGLSVALVELFTGRTHQIRLHCAHLGYPVLGDKLYVSLRPAVANHSASVEGSLYLSRVRSSSPQRVELHGTGARAAGLAYVARVSRHLLHAAVLSLCEPAVEHVAEPGRRWTFFSDPVPWLRRDVQVSCVPYVTATFDASNEQPDTQPSRCTVHSDADADAVFDSLLQSAVAQSELSQHVSSLGGTIVWCGKD